MGEWCECVGEGMLRVLRMSMRVRVYGGACVALACIMRVVLVVLVVLFSMALNSI